MDETDRLDLGTEKILGYRDDGIGWLVFNQPERRNAISLAMWDAIARAASSFAEDAAIRVVVMRDAGGKAFASGADISEFEAVRGNAAAEAEYSRRTNAARAGLEQLGKPLIAMIDGFCIGGGCEIAMVADIRFASQHSRFGIPAARLGVSYAYESLRRLVQLVGPAFAKEVMYTGRQFDAAEALAMGLVNRIVAADQLDDVVTAMAWEIARNAPLSIRSSAETIEQIVSEPDRRDPARIAELSRLCFDSADYREGRVAFIDKREPKFMGR